MHTKRFKEFFNRWVQFRVGAIPRLPHILCKQGDFVQIETQCTLFE